MEIIKPLSDDVQSMMRSGFIITCFTTVVEELIYNSLDAGATKVSVSIAVNNGYVKVEDDGFGISRSGLVLLGERYATSKLQHFHEKVNFVGTFGFRGEVLCSIADVSLVEIVTRVQGRPNGYRKVMKGRKCLCLSIDNDRQAVGTTGVIISLRESTLWRKSVGRAITALISVEGVIVRDLFYNQPVRRRQMQCSAKKVLHSVKKCAVRIALVQPYVSFKVIDMESEDELLCTRSCPSPLSLLCSNFGIKASSLHELNYSEGPLKLTGYVSALSKSFSSKAVQYIYVNSRFVVKGPIHKFLNRLADKGLNQLRGDRGVKQSQPQGPFYCLNLTCPCYSYDLNLDFSRAAVEFKDWAPVLAFVEKSVMSLWSEEIKRGVPLNHEAEWIREDGNEDVVEKTSAEKDCWLKTCEMSTKRRRTQIIENQHGRAKYSLELPVKDCDNLSLWGNTNSESVRESHDQMGFFGVSDALHSNCIRDGIGSDLLEPDKGLVNQDFLQNGVISVETEANEADNCCSSSRSKGEVSIEDPIVGCYEKGSILCLDFMPQNDSNRVSGARTELPLQGSSWANPLQTPLYFEEESQFPIGNFKAKRCFSNSYSNINADNTSQMFDIFESPQCQSDVANTWPLPKSCTESCTRENLDVNHLACNNSFLSHGGIFDRDYPLESSNKRGRVLFPCSPMSIDSQPAFTCPFLKLKDWDFDNFIQEGGFKRSIRNNDDFEHFNLDKEELYCSGLNDRFSNRNCSSPSWLNAGSLFPSDFAGVEKGLWEFPPHGHNVNETAPIRSYSFQDIYSPSMDRRHGDASVSCNPLISSTRGIEIDLEVPQGLVLENFPGERSGRTYDDPDDLLTDRCEAMITSETSSPSLDFQLQLNSFKPSVCCFSSVSAGKGPEPDPSRCQVLEANYDSSESRSSLRSRRSHSAPPFYRGKKRFLSVTCYSASITKNSGFQTASQNYSASERTQLKHPPRLTLSCSVNHQSDEMRQKVEETSSFTPVNALSLDGNTEIASFSNGYLMNVRDSENLQTKWREGCADARLKETATYWTAAERLNDLKENEILDIQSCMLHLVGDSLVPKSINRNDLQNSKVLWQIDNKYIPVVAGGTLAMIDQHAADERIRLEEMRQMVVSGEMKSVKYLEKEKDMVLPEMTYQLLCNYADHIKHWGWICNIFSEDSGSFAKNLNFLNERRTSNLTLIAVPCILGVNLSDADLVEYLEQLADTDGSSTIPPSVVRVLNFKACRGAIMFGDKLLPSECSLIVKELKRTSLCFQCAHGRPTTVPLVDLKALHKGILHLGSWHDHSKNTWHGLCRNKITLDRAKSRLDVTRGCG